MCASRPEYLSYSNQNLFEHVGPYAAQYIPQLAQLLSFGGHKPPEKGKRLAICNAHYCQIPLAFLLLLLLLILLLLLLNHRALAPSLLALHLFISSSKRPVACFAITRAAGLGHFSAKWEDMITPLCMICAIHARFERTTIKLSTVLMLILPPIGLLPSAFYIHISWFPILCSYLGMRSFRYPIHQLNQCVWILPFAFEGYFSVTHLVLQEEL